MEDTFRTLRGEAVSRIRVLGSTFLGRSAHAATALEAEEFIRMRRREHVDATHHCSAYRLGVGGGTARAHDDGEPAGTAGRPILAAIEKADLTDVVLVVTRWFGGTKLGTAGLARAYGQAAADALAAAVIETRYRTVRLQISFPHDQTNAVMHAVARAGARVVGQSYDDAAHLTVELRMSRAAGLSAGVIEATRGRATVAALPAGPPAGAADGASGS